MKRVELIRHMEANGSRLRSDTGKHSVYFNPANGKSTTVPRHREINDFLVKKICRDVDIPEPP